MRRIEIVIDDYLYQFYEKIGENVGIQTEQVISDCLLKFAGSLSESLMKDKPLSFSNQS